MVFYSYLQAKSKSITIRQWHSHSHGHRECEVTFYMLPLVDTCFDISSQALASAVLQVRVLSGPGVKFCTLFKSKFLDFKVQFIEGT